MYVLQATYPVNFMSKRFVFFLLSFLISQMVSAQSPEVLETRKYVNKNAGDIVNEFTGLLALPNVAVDPAGQQKKCRLHHGYDEQKRYSNASLAFFTGQY